MNDQIESGNKNKKNYKIIGISLILLIGLILLSVLYIEFERSYKRNESAEAKNIIPATPLAQPVVNPTLLAPSMQENAKPIPAKQNNNNLIKLFYQMRQVADKGKDFSQEAEKLDQFKTTISPDFDNLLTELEILSSRNTEDEYFRHSFANLIHDLYRQQHDKTNSIHGYTDNLLFIRPTGERAIKRGGFDMDIALTEQALAHNNLELAQSYLKNIPNESDEFQTFLLRLDTRIKIKHDLEKLNKIAEQQ